MWDNSRDFIQEKIPSHHPLSEEYSSYWKQEFKKVVEGEWKSGVWIPPQLYHYYNFGSILVGEEKDRYRSRPFNYDYVWDFYYYWIEARGLSGFEKVGDIKDIRSFLRTRQSEADLGKPLYNNQAKNLLMMANRGFGKSYMAADIAAHEYLTDGKRYIKHIDSSKEDNKHTAEILLGAYVTTYVNDLITKIQDTLNSYPGGVEINGEYYPPPFYKTLNGSFIVGKRAEHFYKKNIGGKWIWKGSRSCFKPRVFKDKPQAGVGGRNTVAIMEEVGTHLNIISSHFANENTQKLNNYKFGSTLLIGTAGNAANTDIQKMVYDPQAYDCLCMEDTFEQRGKISIYFPITYTKLDYKDKNGITDWELAKISEEREREIKRKAKSTEAYQEYVIYNTLVPSELFLSKNSNRFPLKDLQWTLAQLETKTSLREAEYHGDLTINEYGGIEWISNPKSLPIYEFPLKSISDKTGNVVIYEQPYIEENYSIPNFGRYIGGIDPYDTDDAGTDSLGCTMIFDRLTNRIVAELTGRPSTAESYYEESRRLIIYYNALTLYENNKIGIQRYFERTNSMQYLAYKPKMLKDVVEKSTSPNQYGLPMTKEVKAYGLSLINSYLRETVQGEQTNCHKIRCIPLLKELILYNPDLNCDRIMALMCVLYQRAEMYRIEVVENKPTFNIMQSDFFKRGLVWARS